VCFERGRSARNCWTDGHHCYLLVVRQVGFVSAPLPSTTCSAAHSMPARSARCCLLPLPRTLHCPSRRAAAGGHVGSRFFYRRLPFAPLPAVARFALLRFTGRLATLGRVPFAHFRRRRTPWRWAWARLAATRTARRRRGATRFSVWAGGADYRAGAPTPALLLRACRSRQQADYPACGCQLRELVSVYRTLHNDSWRSIGVAGVLNLSLDWLQRDGRAQTRLLTLIVAWSCCYPVGVSRTPS